MLVRKEERTARVVANLCSSYASLSVYPPMSINPPRKETNVSSPGSEHTGMFYQANGVPPPPPPGPLTNRWLGERPVREARKSQSECQLAGLRPQQRHLPITHKHTLRHAPTRCRTSIHSRPVAAHTLKLTHGESPGSTSFHSAGL